MHSILIVEDDPPLRLILEEVLKKRGYETASVNSAAAALAHFERAAFDILITDLMMQPMDGLALMEAIRAQGFEGPVIFITANDDVQTALRALRAGAFDYVVKPLRIPELLATVERAIVYRERINTPVVAAPPGGEEALGVIARSAAMRRVMETARRIALTDVPVLITGEAGVGKSLVARLMHDLSHRQAGPFIELDCRTALGDRVREVLVAARSPASAAGTLLLDHVDRLALDGQELVVNFLDELSARDRSPGLGAARLLATTAVSLPNRMAAGAFLPALYQRLSLLQIPVPPLRERREDRAPLALELARRIAGRAVEMEPAALALIAGYPWPGNVTEMEQAIAQAVRAAARGTIRADHLPANVRAAHPDMSVLDAGVEALRGRWLVGYLRSRGMAAARTAADDAAPGGGKSEEGGRAAAL